MADYRVRWCLFPLMSSVKMYIIECAVYTHSGTARMSVGVYDFDNIARCACTYSWTFIVCIEVI